jgi:excisionase family DNA binding protein
MMLTDIAGLATISVPEAGQVLGIGRDAAYAAANRGELPVLRLGRAWRVPVPKLLAMLGSETDLENSEAAGSYRGSRFETPTPPTTMKSRHIHAIARNTGRAR